MVWTKELLESYKYQQDTKNDQKECISCGCPITQKDFDAYKMCPFCYAGDNFENEGGMIQ